MAVLLQTHAVISDTSHYYCTIIVCYKLPHLVLPEHDVLVLDWADLAAGVGPDLGRAHVQGHDEEPQRNLGVEFINVDILIL